MTGFPRSAHARYDRDRAPSVPRDQRCSTLTGRCPRPAARRITTATVLCPGASTVTYPGLHRHEASVKGSRRSPARPSPHLWPPDDSGALGLFPGLRTHADRTRARTPGRGQAQSTSLEPRLRHLRHAGPPICEFTRTCATSCRITGPACGATPAPSCRPGPCARGTPGPAPSRRAAAASGQDPSPARPAPTATARWCAASAGPRPPACLLLSTPASSRCPVHDRISRPWPAGGGHEGAMTPAASQVVLNLIAGTAGASHPPPVRCAATSWAATAASPPNRRSPAVTASSAARQSPAADPAGTSALTRVRPGRQRQQRHQPLPQHARPPGEPGPPRPRRQRRHRRRPP